MERLDQIFLEINQTKKLSVENIKILEKVYGDIFFRALDYLQKDNQKVKKNVFNPSQLILWTVEGQEGEYLVYPNLFCQCQNFILDSIYRKKQYFPCKHLLAQKLAQSLNQFSEENFSDADYKKWRK